MKKSRFTEEQIATHCGSLNREHRWSTCAARSASRKPRTHLEKEVRGSRRRRATSAQGARGRERALEAHRCRSDAGPAVPAGGRAKKALKAVKRRELAAWMQERFHISVQRSCQLALLRRSVWYAKSQAIDQSALRLRIREIAMNRPRFGYLRVHVMLRREGGAINKKRVYRLYRLDALQLRMKAKRRKRISLQRGHVTPATSPGQHGAWTSSTIRWN